MTEWAPDIFLRYLNPPARYNSFLINWFIKNFTPMSRKTCIKFFRRQDSNFCLLLDVPTCNLTIVLKPLQITGKDVWVFALMWRLLVCVKTSTCRLYLSQSITCTLMAQFIFKPSGFDCENICSKFVAVSFNIQILQNCFFFPNCNICYNNKKKLVI